MPRAACVAIRSDHAPETPWRWRRSLSRCLRSDRHPRRWRQSPVVRKPPAAGRERGSDKRPSAARRSRASDRRRTSRQVPMGVLRMGCLGGESGLIDAASGAVISAGPCVQLQTRSPAANVSEKDPPSPDSGKEPDLADIRAGLTPPAGSGKRVGLELIGSAVLRILPVAVWRNGARRTRCRRHPPLCNFAIHVFQDVLAGSSHCPCLSCTINSGRSSHFG